MVMATATGRGTGKLAMFRYEALLPVRETAAGSMMVVGSRAMVAATAEAEPAKGVTMGAVMGGAATAEAEPAKGVTMGAVMGGATVAVAKASRGCKHIELACRTPGIGRIPCCWFGSGPAPRAPSLPPLPRTFALQHGRSMSTNNSKQMDSSACCTRQR